MLIHSDTTRTCLALSILLGGHLAVGAFGDDSGGITADVPDHEWQPLLGKDGLDGWRAVRFGGEGTVGVSDGVLSLAMGKPFTGVVWTNPVVRSNYEIELEARRDDGRDFFCGLTVPVKDAHCSLIVGGWGGGMVGISSIDGHDASENETSQYRQFEQGRWYRIRFRVTDARLQVWLDNKSIIDTDIRDRHITLRPGDIEQCAPLGIATWETAGSIRHARLRVLPERE